MLLSRFWYVVMAVALGAVLFVLFLSTTMFDRASVRSMGEALAGDSQVVASYLRDDARKRSISLIVPALDDDIRTHLAKASASLEKIPSESKEKVRTALRKQYNAIPPEQKFDALFAVDQAGRVVAQVGFDQASGIDNFELGGYAVVADALHGWIRDDSWVLGGRIYRVVVRPVEHDVSQAPAGAIVGLRILDDTFARELSKRTGAAIGFYANGARISSGAPDGFDVAQLDTITTDLKGLDADPTYKDKGFSDVRTLHDDLGVVYARLVGEAWDVGAGYAVARTAHLIGSPLGFLHNADDKDKHAVPLGLIILLAILVAGLGLGFSFLEHTRPLHIFRLEAERFAKGSSDQLTPSKFRGVFRQLASNLNEGIEKALAKGGTPRRAADLDAVLGPMPVQPSMSAFSIPQDGTSSDKAVPASAPGSGGAVGSLARAPSFPLGGGAPAPRAPMPTPATASAAFQAPAPAASGPKPIRAPLAKPANPTLVGVAPAPPAPSPQAPTAATAPTAGAAIPRPIPAAGRPAHVPGPVPFGGGGGGAPPPRASFTSDEDDEETVVSQVPSEILGQLSADRDTGRPPAIEDEATEWRRVYEEFVQLKKECNEATEGISFEKFKNTLRKNRDQLLQRHACKSVRFSVYVKDGKAALKASPVRD
jgi:hypothetical protein